MMKKLEYDIANGRELDWFLAYFFYDTGVQLDETPIINFCNYRYKIVDIFAMTYRQEKAALSVEIATPDILLIIATFCEYKIMDRLQPLNSMVANGGHSWPKLLAMAKNNVCLLINTGFAIMHLFAADLVPLSDNESVYCYILAAAVVGSMNKEARNTLTKEIQKHGLKRHQRSISDRAEKSSMFGSNKHLLPKDGSGVSEAAYIKGFQGVLTSLPSACGLEMNQKSIVKSFIFAAQRLSMRKSCLQSLANVDKNLLHVSRLLHLSNNEDSSPKRLVEYIGVEHLAKPANDLGSQCHKSSASRSSFNRNSRLLI